MEKIEHPRVFISYAWGTEEYKERVLSFAIDLLSHGIDVELDRWSLKEGYDSNAFMERCVNDPTITNVIILLDPIYAKKADARTGGVGTEAQIISPEIYNRTRQEKFIPVIFERNENGDVLKPTFLKGLLHFDLTREESYDSEFQRLVKRLYGQEAIKKPELGAKPAWVDKETVVQTKIRTSYEILKTNQPERIKRSRFVSFLRDVRSQLIQYNDDSQDSRDLLSHYEKMQTIRDQFLLLMRYYIYVEDSVKYIIDFFEETKAELTSSRGELFELKEFLLYELFIYVVAFFYREKEYSALTNLFCKTYFFQDFVDNGQSFEAFQYFLPPFDDAVRRRDAKPYYSGAACWWTSHINPEICSKDDFVFADLLCFNASIIIGHPDIRYWFPVCYVYDREQHSSMARFANRLRSRENLADIVKIFGFDDAEAFRSRIKTLESPDSQRNIQSYRYRELFDCAPYIGYYIKASEIGSKR